MNESEIKIEIRGVLRVGHPQLHHLIGQGDRPLPPYKSESSRRDAPMYERREDSEEVRGGGRGGASGYRDRDSERDRGSDMNDGAS